MKRIQVALYQPEIPGNTGNIIRLCANTGSKLHLIGPLGFEMDNTKLRRAGLDYCEWADIIVHDNYEQFAMHIPGTVVAFSTHGGHSFYEHDVDDIDALLFGPETRGLPTSLRDSLPDINVVRLPMVPGSRSLNLSNAVAIAVYELWHRRGFQGGQT